MIAIQARCEDNFEVEDLTTGSIYHGIIPKEIGIGCGGHLIIKLCLSCMTVQTPMLSSIEVDNILDLLFKK